jgi:hypothetical protein
MESNPTIITAMPTKGSVLCASINKKEACTILSPTRETQLRENALTVALIVM